MDIPDDNDRIYFINTNWLRENVRFGESPPMEFKLVPADDPNKYIMQIIQQMPKVYIKRADVHQRGDDWEEV